MELERIRQELLKLAKKEIKKQTGRDVLIVRVVDALDEMNGVLNQLYMTFREWYGIHMPEMAEQIKDHEKFVKAVLRDEGTTEMGLDMTERDKKALHSFSDMIMRVIEERKRLERYLDSLMKEVAPHVSEVAGTVIGARLIAKAGGLRRLAFFPSSTIQLLGAEKALFRHLTSGSPPPKHGIIFQHPSIQGKPRKERGRAARKLAAKISIAARMDYFGGKSQ